MCKWKIHNVRTLIWLQAHLHQAYRRTPLNHVKTEKENGYNIHKSKANLLKIRKKGQFTMNKKASFPSSKLECRIRHLLLSWRT